MGRPCSTGMWKWRNALIAAGLNPVLSILEECSIDAWEDRERWWIDHFRSQPNPTILNVLNGGNGSGECGELTREKRRLALVGRKRSPETVAKVAAANRGKKRSMEARLKTSIKLKGRIHSKEEIAKRTATRRTPEARAKQSAAIKGKKHTEESIVKMKLRWSDDAKAKQSEHLSNPDIKAKMSNVSKSQWQDPEFRERQMAIRNSPEYKARMSESVRLAKLKNKEP